ncbi:ATP-grasp fold amidoligase family protein [Amphibacillus sp. Q70]|uniref:ATP-grasp fold amidoligase family protein n=1 Tax=Amphibacillus sp. Q70 TaxID=3453416 RepID=UPI003F867302
MPKKAIDDTNQSNIEAKLNENSTLSSSAEKNTENRVRKTRKGRFFNKLLALFRVRHSIKLIFKPKKKQVEDKNQQFQEVLKNQLFNHFDKATDAKIVEEDQRAIIKMIYKKGDLSTYIDSISQFRNTSERIMFDLLKYSNQMINKNDNQEIIKQHLTQIVEASYMNPIPEFIVRHAKNKNIELTMFDSFSNQLTIKERKNQLWTDSPDQLLDNKELGYQFVDRLGIKYPKQSEIVYTYQTIPKTEGIVIKPVNGAGSRGVYLVYSSTKIFDLKRQEELTSWDNLSERMERDLDSNFVEADEWITENLLLMDKVNDLPAKDFKFYCFYGEVALILEIERYPHLRYCWWDRSGNQISTGKYDYQLFNGEGVHAQDIEVVEKISREIPTAFMRIDFLKAEDSFYFGEFTPKPGNFDHFDRNIDEWLGRLFLQAETQLNQDLINGKTFTVYQKIVNDQSKSVN